MLISLLLSFKHYFKMDPGSLPPIPPELIRPAPVELVIQPPRTAPSITIRPPDPTQINEVIETGKTLPITNQPVIIQPSHPVQIISQPLTQRVLTLDDLLTKRDSETMDYFTMRATYSRAAMNVFGGKINAATAALLGQMAADKATYGVVYPEESDRVIRYINSQI